MHARVLADLEGCQVEPECPELPAKLRDLAPGDALQAVLDERLLDLDELGVEVGRTAVPAAQWCGLAGQGGARAAQPLGDEPEPLAIWLVGEPPPKLPVRLGQVLGVAGQP